MDRQSGGRSRQQTTLNRNQSYETTEMYEQVDLDPNKPSQTSRANPNPYQDPNTTSTREEIYQNLPTSNHPTPVVTVASQEHKKKGKKFLIVITAAVLLSLLALSLVAVVVYSPLAKSSNEDRTTMMTEIQQLKQQIEQLQMIQGTNFTVNKLTSLQESQQAVQNEIDQLTAFQTSITSQLISVHSLVQSLSTVLSNNVDDLTTLRTVNLYENCIQETGSCTINVPSSSYYWRTCSTSSYSVSINRTGYYTTDMRCEYDTNYGYLESAVLHKNSAGYVQCLCDVIYPASRSSTLNTLTTSLTATCTLVVTRCPTSENVLN